MLDKNNRNTIINLRFMEILLVILTFILLGIWYDAGLSFVLFGLCYGIGVIGYTLFNRYFNKVIEISIMFIFGAFGFAIFRTDNIKKIVNLFSSITGVWGASKFLELTPLGVFTYSID